MVFIIISPLLFLEQSKIDALSLSLSYGCAGMHTKETVYLRLTIILFLQRLYKSFKENQYPERATKESLAQELGLTFQKVLFFALTMKTVSFFLKNLVDIVVCFGSHFLFFSIFIG